MGEYKTWKGFTLWALFGTTGLLIYGPGTDSGAAMVLLGFVLAWAWAVSEQS